jgi:protoporphyrinogen oxidase
MPDKDTKIAIIAGAGPAGLTFATELLKKTNIHPIVYEASNDIGGISKTVTYKGNRMDIGGHRFFSKDNSIMKWWSDLMPIQESNYSKPDIPDNTMLLRNRVSRIFYFRKFFDYPIALKLETFLNMGFANTIKAGIGFLHSSISKQPEDSLEAFYINRFGKPLYSMFFEDYTEKVWGIHPSKLGADWGSQRVKGLSLLAIIKDMFNKKFTNDDNSIMQKGTETSLIEKFIYPKYGPGQLWELVASNLVKNNGELHKNSEVVKVNIANSRVQSIVIRNENGEEHTQPCEYFVSTMPLKDLINAICINDEGEERRGEERRGEERRGEISRKTS